MPLTSSDIVFYYTNTGSQSATTLSLGGSISNQTIPDNVSGNVFDDVTGDESASGDTEYRAIAVKDTNATYDMLNTRVWISGTVRASSGFDTISFALSKPTGTTIELIANESSAPDTLRFTVATGATTSWTTEGAPSATLVYGTLPAGSWFGVWLRRVVPASATAFTNRAVTLSIQCETTASPYAKPLMKQLVAGWNRGNFYVMDADFENTKEV